MALFFTPKASLTACAEIVGKKAGKTGENMDNWLPILALLIPGAVILGAILISLDDKPMEKLAFTAFNVICGVILLLAGWFLWVIAHGA